MSAAWVAVALTLLLFGPGYGQDPHQVLRRTGETYRGLDTCRFQGVTTSQTAIGNSETENQLAFEIALAKPDKVRVDFRYANAGEWIRVSDGATTWRYRSLTGDLRQSRAKPEDLGILKGTILARYQRVDEKVVSATLVSFEDVPVRGVTMPCYVIEVRYESRRLLPGTEQLPTRYWIDRKRFVVLRETSATRSTSASGVESRNTRTTTFSVASINEPVEASVFTLDARVLALR
jgi:outer membrane lipoprotein-sorting protein